MANILFGIVWYIPVIISVRYIIVDSPSAESLYWLVWSITGILTSLTLTPMYMYGRKVGDTKDRKTIDEIIVGIENRISSRRDNSKSYKNEIINDLMVIFVLQFIYV